MSYFTALLIIFQLLGIVGTIGQIDEPREPITKGVAVLQTMANLVIIYGLLNWI